MAIKSNLWGVVVALSVWAAPTGVLAATLFVPSEYPTIQAGIDASADGDVVLVAPGTYTGVGNRNLDPGTKNITILGEGGPTETVIDCEGQSRGLSVHGGQTEAFQFIGFTIRNGSAVQGAGFRADQGSKITMVDCVIENCIADALTCFGEGVLRRSTISQCAGDYILSWQTGVIEECEIVDNTRGAALIVAHPYPGSLAVDRTLISGNRGGGARLQVDEVDVVVRSSVISNNGSALLLSTSDYDHPFLFEQCTIASNGATVLEVGRADFDRCILSGLSCGGLWNSDTVTFTCCLFDPDRVYGDGNDPIVEGGFVDADPVYCEPSPCGDFTSRADFSLHEDSPCTVENSPCGEQIGAFGVGCGAASVDLSEASRVSRITFTSAMPARDALHFRLPSIPAETTPASAAGFLEAEILTLGGRRITTRMFHLAEASAEVEWNPEADGVEMVSGIYFLRATRGDGTSAAAKFVWLD